ncbi:MAG: MarR family transcriptional regulator [Chloroflexota bacterium]|nr:MarR family transcriptional regulator [Chloroflexota bacterium]
MEQRRWMFLSNHAHVLVALEADPDVLLRDVAVLVGITERAVHQVIVDLEVAGVVARTRVGRRNHYTINRGARLRHPLEADVAVGALLDLVLGTRHNRRPRATTEQ